MRESQLQNEQEAVVENLSPATSARIVELIRDNIKPYGESGNVLASTHRRLENLYETYSQDGAHFYVAKDVRNDRCIGGVGLGSLHGLPISEGFGEIRDLVLEHAYRGKGIGSHLLGMAIDKAMSIGYDVLYLEVTPNMVMAQKLFRRFGFRPVTLESECKGDMPSLSKREIECYYLLEIRNRTG
ncbi:MAG: GNAT family N-acetyltransferase [Pseudomonadota bacterium]|nr:GNAT family N-acetyltransferase [Pseudomonadota bacterium]